MEELRKRLGTGNKYKEYSNFKLRVIDPARRELSEKTDIKFNYEELKKGRKVVALKFIISTNREKRTKIVEDTKSTEETLLEELNGLARGYHVSNEVFYRWVALGKNIWGLEYTSQLRNLILYINQQSNKNNPIGLANYLLKEKGKLAQQGYDSTIQVEKKEILPEWFNKNNDGNDKKDSRKKEVTYIERQEMEKLLEKYKVY
ncbi:replication initiation protein [Salinibacillus kushneri]|uniref:replication initiation protein n=1 Tax=Salinibacillus kushneri TaxID=237682 RepID=UPI0031841FBF